MPQPLLSRWTTDPEYIELFNYLITQTKDAKSPINIQQLIRDFKEKSGTALKEGCLKSRIERMREIIHSFDHINTDTKVKLLFVLSVSVNRDFLQELSNDANVVVDGNNRITHYKSERFELKGFHTLSMRGDTKNYWKNDMECIDLLNFLIETTKNVKSPMSLAQLARNSKKKSGTALTEEFLTSRIKRMRNIIHSFDHIYTDTKVRMLIVLSVPVNRDFLQELYNDAHVVVDGNNRITHYKSKSLELNGCHRLLKTKDTKNCWTTTDMERMELLNYLIEATENVKLPMSLAQLARDFKEKSGALQTAESLEQRIERMRTNIHSFWHIVEKVKVKLLFALSAPVNAHFLKKLRERAFVRVDEMNRITHYKAFNDGMELSGDHSKAARLITAKFDSERSHHPPTFETTKSSKRKAAIWVSSSSKKALSSSNHSSLELQVDYNTSYSIDDQVKLEPFRGEIQEDLNGIVEEKDIQQIPKPMETPIKIEYDEPVEFKPETSHNSRTQFFEAIQSLIFCLDTPSLSEIQSKIHQKIQKISELDEVILNTEIVQIVDSLISQINNTSVVILSGNAETVNLSNFLCYLKASILNSKLGGVEGLVQKISKLIEESQNKRVPMEKVTSALRVELDIDSF